MLRNTWVRTHQLSSLALEAMVTQINILKEGLKQIETWETQKTYCHILIHELILTWYDAVDWISQQSLSPFMVIS